MMTYYANRAGRKLSPREKKKIQTAKNETVNWRGERSEVSDRGGFLTGLTRLTGFLGWVSLVSYRTKAECDGPLKDFISHRAFLRHAKAWASDVRRGSARCNFFFSTI
jgi:hypothetical protein